MKAFSQLFLDLDSTTKTSTKTAALTNFFHTAEKPDRVWAIALLAGRRPKRTVTTTELRKWAAELAGIPLWLFEESYAVAGDLAETIALLLPEPAEQAMPSLDTTLRSLVSLAGQPEDRRKEFVHQNWQALGKTERFLFNKLLTGGFRMGVSQGLTVRALSLATGVEEADLAHRLTGEWDPLHVSFDALIAGDGSDTARPYPFALAASLETAPESLGEREDWFAEWKWDGIRGQVIQRPGAFAVWSRGEELITDRFPEFQPLADFLPMGTVMDGEILAWDGSAPLPFAELQKRIGRKAVPKRMLTEIPAHFLAYDLLEDGGQDIRTQTLDTRRRSLAALLVALPSHLPVSLSPAIDASNWEDLQRLREDSRDMRAEGMMLKRKQSPYFQGRKRGDWWKWKIAPMTVDAVMIYAQAGHGRRANLFSDFTFAVRDGNALIPFAKAYSGLTDAEFAEITRWVQKNTLERFGPVRRVPPELVFELAFEGIQQSPRHKSGIALRFPRILRWRKDKPASEIDSLQTLLGLLG